jgi:hypothetical protein
VLEEACNTYGIYGKEYQILVQFSEGGKTCGRPSRKWGIILKYIAVEYNAWM